MKNKITIELEESSSLATLRLPNEDGTYSNKLITIDDLCYLLEQSSETFSLKPSNDKKRPEVAIKFDTTLLPSNNGCSVIQSIELNNENKIIVLKKDAHKHDFVYHKSTFSNVGIPTLLFFLQINKNNIIYHGTLYAIKGNAVTPKTKMFHYPFTNVGGYGHICFGANQESLNLKSIRDLHSFCDKFLMMPSRHELYYKGALGLSIRPLLELLSGMDFEDEFLEPTNSTYESVLMDLIKKS